MSRRIAGLFVTFVSVSVVYGHVPRETSAFASHCEGTVCNLLLGIKNIPQKNHTTSPQTMNQQMLPVLGTSIKWSFEHHAPRNPKEPAKVFQPGQTNQGVSQRAGGGRNNTQRHQTQVRNKLDSLERQFNALRGVVGGATSSGVISNPDEKLDLSRVVATDCAALHLSGVNTSGVYLLQPDPTDNRTRFRVLCDMDTDGGGWTVIQTKKTLLDLGFNPNQMKEHEALNFHDIVIQKRRQYGSEDFFRGWKSYTEGFGDLDHDFWLGLGNMHLLTKFGNNKMRFDLKDWSGKSRESTFDFVRILDESDKFRILAGGYHGNAGDPFHTPNMKDSMQSMRFSTYDNDNDMNPKSSCARTFRSGWWFNNCFLVNPNGIWYPLPTYGGKIPNGIIWNFWHPNGYSLRSIEIKLRPERFGH